MNENRHRAWAEVSLCAIEHNYQVICAHSRAPVLCVVKADAYGHGAVQVAQRLQAAGAPYFAVAAVSEAAELRENGISAPILVLGYIDAADMQAVVQYGLTATVYDMDTAHLLSEAAVRANSEIKVHYKLDTGMTRLGFAAGDCAQVALQILECSRLAGLRSEGIFTHFAVADEHSGEEYTKAQFQRFHSVCRALSERGLALPLRHCANSGAIQQYADMHCTMTRAGIILYGYRPDAALPQTLDLRPAMAVKARVVQVREVDADTPVSYGLTYRTDKKTNLAVVAIGYADGYLRTGSGKAQMLVGGEKTPVRGRICMDMCMVRVPDGMQVRRGDEVTVFGADKLTAEDVAQAAGTIAYEVLCAVSRRVPRIFID